MVNEKDDEEISIDLGKITNFFKKKKKKEVEEIKDDSVKIERKVEEKIFQERQELEKLQKDEQTLQEVKKEIAEEEADAAKIDREEEKFDKKVEDTKVKIESVKTDVQDKKEDEEISIDLGKVKRLFQKKEKQDVSLKDQKDDDEISFDFSKIKGIFKGKKEERVSSDKTQVDDSDDEVSFDFKKLKNIKNIFKRKDTSVKEEDDISIDWKKTSDFMKKYAVIFLILIPIFFSIFLRVQSAYLPLTDDWARDAVMNNLRNQVRSQIDQQYPNLPDQNKNALVSAEVQKLAKEQKVQIDQQIEGTSNYFKSRLQNDKGQTYLLAIDPWFWMRHTRNILENGYPGDEIRNNKQWDTHMFAPLGRPVPPDMFHAYFQAYLYKFISFFNRDVELIKVVFFSPVILSALAVIPAFFITRRLGGNFGGFVGAFIVAIHPAFLNRTAGGFSDTDAYNVLFPLLVAWLFLEALESKSLTKSIILSALSGVFVGFFAFAWGGWWFIFQLMIVSAVIYLIYYLIVNRKSLMTDFSNFIKRYEIKNTLLSIVTFSIFSAIFVSILKGSIGAFTRFLNPTSSLVFARLKEVAITTVWPNVFTTVAEQNPSSLSNVINQIGLGQWLFLLAALIGIAYTLVKSIEKNPWYAIGTLVWYIIIFIVNPQNLNMFLFLISIPIIIGLIWAIITSDKEIDIKYAIILILWLTTTIYASVKGVRFLLLLVPPFAIGFGIALGQIYNYLSKWISKGFHLNKVIAKVTIGIILLLILINPYKAAADTSIREIPSMNDAWYMSLDKINQEAEPDAIINSWWDFGHWFKYIGDRAVTFDGTSQNTPMAHWIGHTLLTDNEVKAVGILRMLDCGSNTAFEKLDPAVGDDASSVHILHDIVQLSKEDAKDYLLEYIEEDEADEVLKYTHCEPPENYYITSDDMVGKSGVWAHFGSWDFDRALIYKTLKSKEYQNDLDGGSKFLQERFDYSENEAQNLFYEVQAITDSQQANNWIAPWPGYAGTANCNKADDNTLRCSNFIVNLTTYDIYAPTTEGKRYPKKASFMTNEDLIVKEYNTSIITLQNNRGLGTGIIKNGESYTLLQMDEALTAGMFTRLYYMNGIGLSYFDKFVDESSVFGGKILVWKVDWEGTDKNIIKKPFEEEVEPEPEVEEIPEEQEEINITQDINETENNSNESL